MRIPGLKIFFVLIAVNIFLSPKSVGQKNIPAPANALEIPLGGNSWASKPTGGKITNTGITNWTDPETSFTTYFRVDKPGTIRVWLQLQVPDGQSKIQVSFQNKTRDITVTSNTMQEYYAGEWEIKNPGYQAIKITGLSKTGSAFAQVTNIKLAGSAAESIINFVKNNEGNFFHWGRRGPSVHLGYVVPENTTAEWFYNEITVPKGSDVIGSYFMAGGFAEGYFGIQVNSASERRILFSVWSPFKTDNPKNIPEDQKIKLLQKGTGVYSGEFGNEGSGGQSYLKYNWQAGLPYKFLLHGKPAQNNYTNYTAYFFNPETAAWQLIASFSRPQTNTYLKRLHSFLENFNPETGNITRQVQFTNQWICTPEGKWLELNQARFTGDNTAGQGYRMDYAGGLLNNAFYLQNCGFFNNFTPLKTLFTRPVSGLTPRINFTSLPGYGAVTR